MDTTPLKPAPRAFYAAKATATRARSALWRARRPSPAPGLRILFYHRISGDEDQLAVKPRRFREQMAFLAAGGFAVVGIPRAAELLAAGESPARTLGLSFDDGYLDNAEHALPVLAEHGFAATVFLATAVTDGRVKAAWYERQPPLLSWDDVTELDRGGTLGFEAHTVTHPSLVSLDEAQAREEIQGSKRELEGRLGREVTAFSYPAGLYGERERLLVADAGFRSAVTTEPGPNLPGDDRLLLRRVHVEHRDSLLDFRARVGGGHDRPLPLRGLYRRARYGVEPASSRS